MINIKNFIPRKYQENIANICKNFNTLVILPTGLGKTKIALLACINRLNQFPGKVLILSPTKPLSNQLANEFKEHTDLSKDEIILLTGSINPEKRKDMYNANVIVATPQTISEDIKNNRLNLSDFVCLVIDECHRSRMKYANTFVASKYLEQSKFSRIIALTASPGSTKERIKEICSNLFIDKVEVRDENSDDVKEYVQEKKVEHIYVELGKEFLDILSLIKEVYKEKLNGLKSFGLSKPLNIINRKDLLLINNYLRKELQEGNKSSYQGLSLVAQCLKLSYMIELIETQSLSSLYEFINNLDKDESRAAKIILKDNRVVNLKIKLEELIKLNIKHPKLDMLIALVKHEIEHKSNVKIIVFINYRSTIEEVVNELNKYNIKAVRFVGQADRTNKGLKQKEQIEILNRFNNDEFNVLVSSSIGEEGLSIKEVDLIIHYDQIGSEIRRIQRSGRTGRTKAGKVIFFIAKGTRDEALYWVSHRKEKNMKKIVKEMQSKL